METYVDGVLDDTDYEYDTDYETFSRDYVWVSTGWVLSSSSGSPGNLTGEDWQQYQVDLGNYSIYQATGKQPASSATQEAAVPWWKNSTVRSVASTAISFIPVVGDIKDLQEAVTGVDLVTGEKLSWKERLVTAGAMVVPFAGGAAARQLVKHSDEIGAGLTKTVNRLITNQGGYIQPGAFLPGRTLQEESASLVNRGAELRAQYGHLTPTERQARIQELSDQSYARVAAERDLASGGHAVSRHGPQTTPAQQLHRALTGLTPDGHQGHPSNASRFFTNRDLVNSVQKADLLRNPRAMNNPTTTSRVKVSLPDGVGEIWKKNTGDYLEPTNKAVVRYNSTGDMYSAYPTID